MVGRTPEFMGKKVEAKEMKIAMIIALLHPLLILAGTALSSYLYMSNPGANSAWLNNPGHHGFSEMLYEYTSSAANNGSGFEGLGDNNPGGISAPVLCSSWAASYLSSARWPSPAYWRGRNSFGKCGNAQNGYVHFGIMVFAVIAIITALSFSPHWHSARSRSIFLCKQYTYHVRLTKQP